MLARVNDCWASLYGERVLAYRADQHLTVEPAWDEVKRFAQDFLERRPPLVAVATSVGAAVAWSLGMLPSTFDLRSTAATAVVAGVGGLMLLTSLLLA